MEYRTDVNLLTIENAKTSKGEKLGYLTGILYLAPADESGVINVCQFASPGCKADCLFTSGRGRFESVYKGRLNKTLWLAHDRASFLAKLRAEIPRLVRKAEREGLTPAIRLNGTSDLAWLGLQLSREFPAVQFYDYTKLPKPQLRTRPNYHLTFSRSEVNSAAVSDALAHGVNVAVVFDRVSLSGNLPAYWTDANTGKTHKVIDGDKHDLRFLDGYQSAIIGLRAKGEAKKDAVSGFVLVSSLFPSVAAH